jgi:hypothetical protein
MINDKKYTIKQSDFDLAFEETMMYFKRRKLNENLLDDLLPMVLGVFEASLQDGFPTEHMIEKILTNPTMN